MEEFGALFGGLVVAQFSSNFGALVSLILDVCMGCLLRKPVFSISGGKKLLGFVLVFSMFWAQNYVSGY